MTIDSLKGIIPQSFVTIKVNIYNIVQLEGRNVKNEARMYVINNIPPYSSAVDAISKFPETATALGVKLDEKENVILIAPCGIDDVINLELMPTPYFTETKERAVIYEERIIEKKWKSICIR